MLSNFSFITSKAPHSFVTITYFPGFILHRLKYLVTFIKLKFKGFKEFKETNDVFDFDDQFPVIIEIDENPMYLTEVYVKKNDFRVVMLDYTDMTFYDYNNPGENEQVAYFINYCLNQDKDGKE